MLDLIRGALVAHLHPHNAPPGAVDAADRVRASASGVLMCWVLFAAAGFAFYKTTEDPPFSAAGHAHPLLVTPTWPSRPRASPRRPWCSGRSR